MSSPSPDLAHSAPGGSPPIDAALATLEGLAAQGYADACAALSHLYLDGAAGVAPDLAKAHHHASQGAALGDALSTYALARVQRQLGDAADALALARRAHALGAPGAGILYATMWMTGEGIAPAPAQAVAMLQALARDALPAALCCAEALLAAEPPLRDPAAAQAVLLPHEPLVDVLPTALRVQACKTFGRVLAATGATTPLGRDAGHYVQQAAALGDPASRDLLRRLDHLEFLATQDAAWTALERFDAWGGRWQFFLGDGRLLDIVQRHGRRTAAAGSPVETVQVLHLAGRDGSALAVTVPAHVDAVCGREYVVLYAGPADEGTGIPVLLYDVAGKAMLSTGVHLPAAYPRNCRRRRLGPGLALLVLGGVLALQLAAAWALVGEAGLSSLAFAGAGVLLASCGWRLARAAPGPDAAPALAAAVRFLEQHGERLLARP